MTQKASPKTPLTSKMSWLGLITFAIGLLEYLLDTPFIQAFPEVVPWVVMTIGILTVIFRRFTDRALTFLKR